MDYFQLWKQDVISRLSTSRLLSSAERQRLMTELADTVRQEQQLDPDWSLLGTLKNLAQGFIKGLTGIGLDENKPRAFIEQAARGIGTTLGFLGVIPGPGLFGRVFMRGALRSMRFFESGLFRTLERAVATEAPAIIRIRSLPVYVSDVAADAARGLLAETSAMRFLNGRLGQAAEEGLRLAAAQGFLSAQEALSRAAQGDLGGSITTLAGSSLLGAMEGAGMRLLTNFVFPSDQIKDIVARAMSSAVYSGGVSAFLGDRPEGIIFNALLGLGFGALEPSYAKLRATQLLLEAQQETTAYQRLVDLEWGPYKKYFKESPDPEPVKQEVRDQLSAQIDMLIGRNDVVRHLFQLEKVDVLLREYKKRILEADPKISEEEADRQAIASVLDRLRREYEEGGGAKTQLNLEDVSQQRAEQPLAFSTFQNQFLQQVLETMIETKELHGALRPLSNVSEWARRTIKTEQPIGADLEHALAQAIAGSSSPMEVGPLLMQQLRKFAEDKGIDLGEIGPPPDPVLRDARQFWHMRRRARVLRRYVWNGEDIIDVNRAKQITGEPSLTEQVVAGLGLDVAIIDKQRLVTWKTYAEDLPLAFEDVIRRSVIATREGEFYVPLLTSKDKGVVYAVRLDPKRKITTNLPKRPDFRQEIDLMDERDVIDTWLAKHFLIARAEASAKGIDDIGSLAQEHFLKVAQGLAEEVPGRLGGPRQIADFARELTEYYRRGKRITSTMRSFFPHIRRQLLLIRYLEEIAGGMPIHQQHFHQLRGEGDFLLDPIALNKRLQVLNDNKIRLFASLPNRGEGQLQDLHNLIQEHMRLEVASRAQPQTEELVATEAAKWAAKAESLTRNLVDIDSSGNEVYVRMAIIDDIATNEYPFHAGAVTLWRLRKKGDKEVLEPFAGKHQTDGATILHPALFDALAKYAGLDSYGAFKASAYQVHPELGGLMIKTAIHRATPEMAREMEAKGVGMIVYKSAAKVSGLRKFSKHRFKKRGNRVVWELYGVKKYDFPLSALRVNYSSSEHFHNMVRPQRVPRQMITLLQNRELNQALIEFFRPQWEGNPKRNQELTEALRTGQLRDSFEWDEVGIEQIYAVFNSKRPEIKQKLIRWLLAHQDDILLLDDDVVDEQTIREWVNQISFGGMTVIEEAIQQNKMSDLLGLIPRISAGSERLVLNYMIKRVLVPRTYVDEGGRRYNFASYLVTSPTSHADRLAYDARTKPWKGYRLNQGWVVVSKDVARQMDVKIPDPQNPGRRIWVKLDKAWELKRRLEASDKPEDKEQLRRLEDALVMHLVRVPVASQGGVRNVRIADVTDRMRGATVQVAAEDMIHLGGADYDIDKAYLIQNLDSVVGKKGFVEYFDQFKNELFTTVKGIKRIRRALRPMGIAERRPRRIELEYAKDFKAARPKDLKRLVEVPIFAEYKELARGAVEELPNYFRGITGATSAYALLSVGRSAYIGNNMIGGAAVMTRRMQAALSALLNRDLNYQELHEGVEDATVRVNLPDEGYVVFKLHRDALPLFVKQNAALLNIGTDAADFGRIKTDLRGVINELRWAPLMGAEVIEEKPGAGEATKIAQRVLRHLAHHGIISIASAGKKSKPLDNVSALLAFQKILRGERDLVRGPSRWEALKELGQFGRMLPWQVLFHADYIMRNRHYTGEPITGMDIAAQRQLLLENPAFWEQVTARSYWYKGIDYITQTISKSGNVRFISINDMLRSWIRGKLLEPDEALKAARDEEGERAPSKRDIYKKLLSDLAKRRIRSFDDLRDLRVPSEFYEAFGAADDPTKLRKYLAPELFGYEDASNYGSIILSIPRLMHRLAGEDPSINEFLQALSRRWMPGMHSDPSLAASGRSSITHQTTRWQIGQDLADVVGLLTLWRLWQAIKDKPGITARRLRKISQDVTVLKRKWALAFQGEVPPIWRKQIDVDLILTDRNTPDEALAQFPTVDLGATGNPIEEARQIAQRLRQQAPQRPVRAGEAPERLVAFKTSKGSPQEIARASIIAQELARALGDSLRLVVGMPGRGNERLAYELSRYGKVYVAVPHSRLDFNGAAHLEDASIRERYIEPLSAFREDGRVSTARFEQELFEYLKSLTPEERIWAESYVMSTLYAQEPWDKYTSEERFSEWLENIAPYDPRTVVLAHRYFMASNPEDAQELRKRLESAYRSQWFDTNQLSLAFKPWISSEARRLWVESVWELDQSLRDGQQLLKLIENTIGLRRLQAIMGSGALSLVSERELMRLINEGFSSDARLMAHYSIADSDWRLQQELLRRVEQAVLEGKRLEAATKEIRQEATAQLEAGGRASRRMLKAYLKLKAKLPQMAGLAADLPEIFRGWTMQEFGKPIDISRATPEMLQAFVHDLTEAPARMKPSHFVFPDVLGYQMRRMGSVIKMERTKRLVLTAEGARQLYVVEPMSRIDLMHRIANRGDEIFSERASRGYLIIDQATAPLKNVRTTEGELIPEDWIHAIAESIRSFPYGAHRRQIAEYEMDVWQARFRSIVRPLYDKIKDKTLVVVDPSGASRKVAAKQFIGEFITDKSGNVIGVNPGEVQAYFTELFKTLYKAYVEERAMPDLPRIKIREQEIFTPEAFRKILANGKLWDEIYNLPFANVARLARDYNLFYHTKFYRYERRWTTTPEEGVKPDEVVEQLAHVPSSLQREILESIIGTNDFPRIEIGRLSFDEYYPRYAPIEDREVKRIADLIDKSDLNDFVKGLFKAGLVQRLPEYEQQRAFDAMMGGEAATQEDIKRLWTPSFLKRRGAAPLAFYVPSAHTLRTYVDQMVKGITNTVKAIMHDLNISAPIHIPGDADGSVSQAWRDFLWLYARGTLGLPTVFNESRRHMLQGPYKYFADETYVNMLKRIDDLFGTHFTYEYAVDESGNLRQQPAPPERIARKISRLSRMEGKYSMATLLFNIRSIVNNFFGGLHSTMIETGLSYMLRAMNLKEIQRISGGRLKTWEDVARWAARHGVFESYLIEEGALTPEFNREDFRQLVRDINMKLRHDPTVSEEALLRLAERRGFPSRIIESAALPIRWAERKLRMHAFLAHYLRARDVMLAGGADPLLLDDPTLVKFALRGVENSQFIYSNAERPTFSQSPVGRMFTRFRIWTMNSVRQRLRHMRQQMLRGWGSDPIPKPWGTDSSLERSILADMFVFALAWALPFSFIDASLPSIWGYAKDYAEAIFGNDEERRKAFFGLLPWPANMVQPVLPVSARLVELPLGLALSGDMDTFLNYQMWTLFPGGLILRTAWKSLTNPEWMTETALGLPLHEADRFLESGGAVR